MNLLPNMDNFIRCAVFSALIILSSQEGKKSVNYEPIVKKMQTASIDSILVYERKYEDLVAHYMDVGKNLKWSLLLDDKHNAEFFGNSDLLNASLFLGVDYAVAIGTSFEPVGLIVVIDNVRFSTDVLKLVESQWISPTLVRFYDSRDSMDITNPCSLDLTITYISSVVENHNITSAEATLMEWKYNYHSPAKGECEIVKFSNFDEQSEKWQEFFNGSDYIEKISVGVITNEIFFNQPAAVDVNVTRPGVVTDGNGLEYKLIDYLGKRTNLSFVPKAIKLGAEEATAMETWNVLMKLLDENQIDLAIARIPAMNELVEHYAYSKIYFTEHYYILSTTFSSSDYMFSVFQPLRLKVWALVLLLLFLCGPLFLNMVYFTSKPDPIFTFNAKGLQNSYFHTYRLFFGHATWNHHFCFSFNLFVLTWLCIGLMLIVGYNSTFMASISSGKSKWEINGLEDLLHGVEKGYVNLVLNKNMDGRGPFKVHSIQKNSIYDKILNAANRRSKVRYIDLQTRNLPQLLDDDDVLIADLTASYFLLRKLKDKHFRISHQSIGAELYALFARKGFRYLDKFDLIIRELYEFGNFLGWYNSEMKGKNRNQFQGNTIEGTIMQLEHIYGAILVYSIGVALAVFALLSEVIYKCCKTHDD